MPEELRQKGSTLEISKELLELIGEEDTETVSKALTILKSEVAKAAKVGRNLEHPREEFVVPLVSGDQKERIVAALEALNIFPWEENQLLIIDHERDLAKLRLAGFLPPIEEPKVHRKEAEKTGYEFPLPLGKESIFAGIRKSKEREAKQGEPTELVDADIELQRIIDRFDQGLVEPEDAEFQKRIGVIPTLKLFPKKYTWKNGQLFHSRSMLPVPLEERNKLMESAKAGDRHAVEELVRMHVGLVLKKLARVKEKFGGDADDLFQEGLIGLYRSIKPYEPALGAFSTYALYGIEANMRRAGQTDKTIPLPRDASDEKKSYFEARRRVEKRALNTEVHEREALLQEFPQTENDIGLDKFERTYLIHALFNPLDESFQEIEESPSHRVSSTGESLTTSFEESVHEEMQTEKLYPIIAELPPRDRFILKIRYGLIQKGPLSAQEILESIRSPKKAEVQAKIESLESLPPLQIELEWQHFNELDRILLGLLGKLNLQQQKIVGDSPLILERVGELMGVSRERVRQIELIAIRHLTSPSRIKRIREIFKNE